MSAIAAKQNPRKLRPPSQDICCPLCSTQESDSVFTLLGVPVHQNLLMNRAEEARGCIRGDIDLRFCRRCGYVFNAAFDPSLLSYSFQYDNTQTHSPYFRDYLESLARYLTKAYSLKNKLIVDVGCGKGDFLRLLCADGLNRGVGFDPSYVGSRAANHGSVRFIRRFFELKEIAEPPDLIVSRYVLEHVADPIKLLSEVRRALKGSRKGSVFFEVAGLDWVIDHASYWDLYYEHCSYFWRPTLALAFRLAGFDAVRMKNVFGGQYVWVEGKAGTSSPRRSGKPLEIRKMGQRLGAFASRFERFKAFGQTRIRKLRCQGGCAVWGAGAKGATLLNLLDPECEIISYAIDLNPEKQGRYVPGTGHPIYSPERLLEEPVARIVMMNPNYWGETRALVRNLGATARVERW